jgi:hypothetical protein
MGGQQQSESNKHTIGGCGLDLSGLQNGKMVGSCLHDNETASSKMLGL